MKSWRLTTGNRIKSWGVFLCFLPQVSQKRWRQVGGAVQVFMNNFPTQGWKLRHTPAKEGRYCEKLFHFQIINHPPFWRSRVLLRFSFWTCVCVCACENYCSFLGGPFFSPKPGSQKREPINKVREQKDDSGGKYEEFNIFCYWWQQLLFLFGSNWDDGRGGCGGPEIVTYWQMLRPGPEIIKQSCRTSCETRHNEIVAVCFRKWHGRVFLVFDVLWDLLVWIGLR